jgi:hypothetical protein
MMTSIDLALVHFSVSLDSAGVISIRKLQKRGSNIFYDLGDPPSVSTLRVVALQGEINPDRMTGRTEVGIGIALEHKAALRAVPREPDDAATVAEDRVAAPESIQALLCIEKLEAPLGEIRQNRGENSVES